VNDKIVNFGAYQINGNNYFKLRDLAFALNNTPKKFNILWDGNNQTINMVTGQSYSIVGGEMSPVGKDEKTATPTTSTIFLNNRTVGFKVYQIDGNNYFMLRDIGAALDFGVDWDGEKNAVFIDTNKGYTPPE